MFTDCDVDGIWTVKCFYCHKVDVKPGALIIYLNRETTKSKHNKVRKQYGYSEKICK